MSELDFGAISAQVTEFLGQPNAEGATPSFTREDSPVAPPASAAPPAAPVPGQVASGNPAPVEDLIEVQFKDGRTEKLSRQQIADGVLMQRDYTKKTQELAEHRKQLEPIATAYQQLTQEQQDIQALFKDPQLLAQFINQTYGTQFSQILAQLNQPNPLTGVQNDDVITAQQAAAIAREQTTQHVAAVQQRLQELEQRFEAKTQAAVQAGMQQLETSQSVAAQQKVLDAHLTGLFEAHPILGSIPEMEDVIRFRVISRAPSSPEEAQKMLTEEATKQVKALETKFSELQKTAIAGKQKLATHGIEPPGGQGVQPEPRGFKTKDGGIDWKNLSASALQYMDNGKK